MGIRSRLGVEGKAQLTAIANLGAAIKRAFENRLPTSRESVPIDMLASNFLPYQVSRTYNAIMVESTRIRAQTIVDAQRLTRQL